MSAPTSPDRAHSPTPPTPDGGRDAHGRFGKGNAGGPGNPFARQVAALRCALLNALTPQDIAAVVQALLRHAQDGNVAAAKLLLAYGLGRPAAAVDPDTLDQHEWELYRRAPDPSPEMLTVTKRFALPVALDFMRGALAGLEEHQARMFRDGLADLDAKDRAQAQARARRARKKAAAPAAPPPGALPPDVARALEILADDPEALALFLPPPGTSGGAASPCQAVPPPSPNGDSHKRRPGG